MAAATSITWASRANADAVGLDAMDGGVGHDRSFVLEGSRIESSPNHIQD